MSKETPKILQGMPPDVYPIVGDVPGVLNCLRRHRQKAWEEVTVVGIGTSGAIMLTLMKIVYPGITPVLLTKPRESTHRSKNVFVPYAPIVVVDDQVSTYATMRTIAKSLGRVRSYFVIGVVAYGLDPNTILEIFPNVKTIIQ